MRVKESNNWGAIEYLNADGRRVVLKTGTLVEIEWPDGTKSRHAISAKSTYTSVSDHGHVYTVEQVRYGVSTTHRGVPVWVGIDQVDFFELV